MALPVFAESVQGSTFHLWQGADSITYKILGTTLSAFDLIHVLECTLLTHTPVVLSPLTLISSMNLMPHLPLLSSHTLTGRSHTSLASLNLPQEVRSNSARPDSLCGSRPPADWLEQAAEREGISWVREAAVLWTRPGGSATRRPAAPLPLLSPGRQDVGRTKARGGHAAQGQPQSMINSTPAAARTS